MSPSEIEDREQRIDEAVRLRVSIAELDILKARALAEVDRLEVEAVEAARYLDVLLEQIATLEAELAEVTP